MPSKNSSAIQVSEENARAMGEAISETMGEYAHTIMRFSICVSEFLAETTALMKRITDSLHNTYLSNGAPYGDSQAGFFLWLKEEKERMEK